MIDKTEFKKLLEGIKCCYAKDYISKLPSLDDFPTELFTTDNVVNFSVLESSAKAVNDAFYNSLVMRLLAVQSLISARETGERVDTKAIWNLISRSLSVLPPEVTISSIGSQGFLSIPLYKYDAVQADFDFIRLHIWDKTLNEYINKDLVEKFSIHTHSFFAESWIICGALINDRFNVDHIINKTDYSFFTVEYNKSLNEINQHKSVAVNSKTFASVKHISHEVHMKGAHYTINAGDFHRSASADEDNLTATLFSFRACKGLAEKSFVLGPSNIEESEINRKMHIDPTDLIFKIDNSFNNE